MGKELTKAEAIRKFVSEHFDGLGEFQTRDVADLAAGSNEVNDTEWTGSHISASLQAWVEQKWLINGYRLEKNSAHGATAKWSLVKVTEKKSKTKEPIRSFEADILEEKSNGSMLVTDGVDYYKVTKLVW